MADSPYTRTLPETRFELEQLIEAAIARLDDIDGDPDLEPACEDEGAACDDEGVEEVDCSDSEDDPQCGWANRWLTPEQDRATVTACVAAVEGVRDIQKRKGLKKLARPVRLLGGVIVRS